MIVTKLEAAVAQITTAVELYFCDADPIVTHVLTMGANEMMRGMLKHTQGIKLIREFEFLQSQEQKKLARTIVNNAYNFFKHADNDPDPAARTSFNPFATEVLLFEAAYYVPKLRRDPDLRLKLFIAWFAAWNKTAERVFQDYPEYQKLEEIRSLFKREDKKLFYLSHASSLESLLVKVPGPELAEWISLSLSETS